MIVPGGVFSVGLNTHRRCIITVYFFRCFLAASRKKKVALKCDIKKAARSKVLWLKFLLFPEVLLTFRELVRCWHSLTTVDLIVLLIKSEFVSSLWRVNTSLERLWIPTQVFAGLRAVIYSIFICTPQLLRTHSPRRCKIASVCREAPLLHVGICASHSELPESSSSPSGMTGTLQRDMWWVFHKTELAN